MENELLQKVVEETYSEWVNADSISLTPANVLNMMTLVAEAYHAAKSEQKQQDGELPDTYPDFSTVNPEQKEEIVNNLMQVSGKAFLSTFMALGLKDHISFSVINDVNGDEFRMSFKKVDKQLNTQATAFSAKQNWEFIAWKEWAMKVLEEKKAIISAVEEGSENWKAEYDNCRSILSSLVQLKDEKDSKGKTDYYRTQQPKVWEAAKNFLEKYQHQ